MSQILLLNGCSSAGKTTLATAIKHISPTPWLRLGVDTIIDMASPKFFAFGEKAAEGYFTFTPGQNTRGPTMEITSGPLADKMFGALPLMAKTLADAGNDLIVDEVLFDDEALHSYQEQLKDHKLLLIGVHCDLKAMQEREILRGDRSQGLANAQFDLVHQGHRPYDLEIDTTTKSPFALAEEVLDFVGSFE